MWEGEKVSSGIRIADIIAPIRTIPLISPTKTDIRAGSKTVQNRILGFDSPPSAEGYTHSKEIPRKLETATTRLMPVALNCRCGIR